MSLKSLNVLMRMEFLARRFGTEQALDVWYDPVDEISLLSDGGHFARCTDLARYIRDREPSTVIFGYQHEDNPSAASELAHGHDFAVVDGRFIVDPWVLLVGRVSTRPVFDLQDPADIDEIGRLFGNRSKWRWLPMQDHPHSSFV